MTDDVLEGRVSESEFRQAIVWLAGTLLAHALLVPSALLIVFMARYRRGRGRLRLGGTAGDYSCRAEELDDARHIDVLVL